MYCVDCIVTIAFLPFSLTGFTLSLSCIVDCRFVTEYYVIRMIIFFMRFVYFDAIDASECWKKSWIQNRAYYLEGFVKSK